MSRWNDRLHRRITPVEGMIWTAALFLVSTACAAAAIAVPERTETAGEPALQASIMIELAPEPEAISPERNAISEDREDAAERPEPVAGEPDPAMPAQPPAETARITPPEPVLPPSEPVLPEPEVKTASVPQPVETPDPIEEQMLAALADMAVPLPLARPEPAPRQKAEPRPDKKVVARKKPAREPASVAAQKPAAIAKVSNRNAAEKTVASSSATKGDANRWKSKVVAHLERRKRYPSSARARGEEGTVLVAFRIDGGGRVLSASLARSSGHSVLDEAALAMVERASPVPAPPSGVGTTLTAPVRFVRR